MTRSVREVGGAVLVVSQFTLYGDVRRGLRPSFDGAAGPELAEALYGKYVEMLAAADVDVATGEFRANMQVSLVNEGPRDDPAGFDQVAVIPPDGTRHRQKFARVPTPKLMRAPSGVT